MKKDKESKIHFIRHGQSDIVNMWLDRYEEIFSDFDPSPFSHRIVSDDFISEARRICTDKTGHIREFNLYLPEEMRNEHEEEIIKKRLHDFFIMRLNKYVKEFGDVRKRGMLFALLGIILLSIITYLFSLKAFSGIIQFVFIVAEPAGWFLIWMGLDNMFFTNKPQKPDMELFKKLAKAEIYFHSTPENYNKS